MGDERESKVRVRPPTGLVFTEVRNDEIRVGDLLANHSTVTRHETGPAVVEWGSGTYELEPGDVFIGCGDGNPHGYAISRCDAGDLHVVGRREASHG